LGALQSQEGGLPGHFCLHGQVGRKPAEEVEVLTRRGAADSTCHCQTVTKFTLIFCLADYHFILKPRQVDGGIIILFLQLLHFFVDFFLIGVNLSSLQFS